MNSITVPLDDYRQLQDVVIDLQKKYQDVVDDKARWRNYAVLSSATLLLAYSPGVSSHFAIKKATELLNMIEQGEQ